VGDVPAFEHAQFRDEERLARLEARIVFLTERFDDLRGNLDDQFEAVKGTINGRIREQDLKVALAESRVAASIAAVDASVQRKEEQNRIARLLIFGAATLILAAIMTALTAWLVVRPPTSPVNLRPTQSYGAGHL